MASAPERDPRLSSLRLPLLLTQAGMLAERLLRCFWPVLSILMGVLAALMLGLHDMAPIEVVWGLGVLAILAALGFTVRGALRFDWPGRDAALARLDATLPGRPIRALLDEQAVGAGDAASAAVWHAHQARMAARAATARPVRPNLRLAARDPYALRYLALLALAVGLIFGSVWRVGSVAQMTPGGAALAGGPTWEGWVEPPRYTGLPTLYLGDITTPEMRVPEGSRITLRFYGEVGALTLAETVSGRIGELPSAADPQQEFTVAKAGELRVDGPGGRAWDVAVIADAPPEVSVSGAAETGAEGELTLPFSARDDYGVTGGAVGIELDMAALDRRYGLAVAPEPRAAITVPLPLPISGNRADFTEKLIEDFSKHAWANLPVIFTLTATDAAGQVGQAAPYAAPLSARHFFDPLAAAIAEQRRDLLWSRENARRVAQILRAVSHRPDEVFRSETAYLRLRVILRRLETFTAHGLKVAQRDEIAEALWGLAILLEEGDLGDALERLRRAQDRLSEAMKNGAGDQEIAELMQELREASDEYLRQLSRQAQKDGQQGDQGQPQDGDSLQMTQNDLQRMMDRIQELMEQGRMAEAQQALEELQQLMENMRVTQGQQGQGGPSDGERAMEDLADTLRGQQGLSDQAFRDLQEQFNPGAGAGQSQQNEGRSGGQGRGQSHDGQGQGQQQGDGQGGDGSQQGQGGQQPGAQDPDVGSLADRQQALREELRRQQGNMPGAGTPEGDTTREALGRAGRAMEGAQEALRGDDLAEAIDRQAEAIEALREGMRALGEAMAQQQQQGSQQQGQGVAQGDMRANQRDPLGRQAGVNGGLGTEEGMLQGEDVYRRARELLDEIRRRSGEGARPEVELDYLRRLLDRF
ncbi:TIGR02302 family protein [Antarcticimicrobium sediminis]|uniref:TIGR02302 family protein n=1 Tax=Antarcticimicrobium sediminis TaxID=2546227 RepID=A0A4V2Z8A9_9RHOB|nr:TIGR02302 family protein [Antarcticimicrobium sediminis]TDE39646.1 TIGR02302 family protein [Antarcticimicrobium sediminis]